MGCHTWCYAHIPEKQKSWEEEMKKDCQKGYDEMTKFYSEYTEKEWLKDYNENKINCQNYIKAYEEASDEEKKEFEDFYTTKERFEEEFKKCKFQASDEYTIEMFQKDTWDYYKKEKEAIDNFDIENIDKNFHLMPWGFGCFQVKDNRIYRDTCTEIGEDYRHQTPVFEKRFGNMFRVNAYDRELWSKQETIDFLKEYINKSKKGDKPENYRGCSIQDLQDVIDGKNESFEEFWNTYEFGMIHFG